MLGLVWGPKNEALFAFEQGVDNTHTHTSEGKKQNANSKRRLRYYEDEVVTTVLTYLIVHLF